MEPADLGLLLLRLGVGGVLLAHGLKHAGGRERTIRWFASIGFRAPALQWFLSTATEIGVGVLVVVGALTGLAAAGLVGIMAVAYWTVHRPQGFWITARPEEGWEYVLVLAVATTALALTGPGAVSVDAAAGIPGLAGWPGAALIVGGLLAAAGQLAVFWRPAPTTADIGETTS